MNNKKGIKYYGIIFVVSVLAIVLYLVINGLQGNDLTPTYMVSLLFVPFFFTLALFVFDRIIEVLIPRKKEPKADEYKQFVIKSTEKLSADDEFEIEDFKKLRENERFQRVLKQIFNIEKNGETEESNYKMVRKRFKKDTLEYKAVIKIIE